MNRLVNHQNTQKTNQVLHNFSNLQFLLYKVSKDNAPPIKTEFTNFNEFIVHIPQFKIFVNGSEFMVNHTKRVNKNIDKIDEMIRDYMSKFVNPENNIPIVFTFHINMYERFRNTGQYIIISEYIPFNTAIALLYNDKALLVFLPTLEIEGYVLQEIYKKCRRNIINLINVYVSTDSFKVINKDLKYDYVNVLQMKFTEKTHLDTLTYDPTFEPITKTISSTSSTSSNNNVVPLSPTTPLLRTISSESRTRRNNSPLFNIKKPIKYTKAKKRMSNSMSMSENNSGKMMYHDFDITEIPCKKNNECYIGECFEKNCENVFNAKHMISNVDKTLYAFNGIQIFRTDNNDVSVKEFYKMLNNDKIRMTKLFPFDTGKKFEITNNIGLENIRKELFNCELFIDYMNVMHLNNTIAHKFNILSNSLLNIILNEINSVKTVVTIQSHKFGEIMKYIGKANRTYNKYEIKKLMINNQIINIIVFNDRLIMVVTPTPLKYMGVERSVEKYSLELDDYMLYYLYTNLRDPDKRNVYLSKDNLNWIIPKSYDFKNVNIGDIFKEKNDIKIRNVQTFQDLSYVTTYNEYLDVTRQRQISQPINIKSSNNTKKNNTQNNNLKKNDI